MSVIVGVGCFFSPAKNVPRFEDRRFGDFLALKLAFSLLDFTFRELHTSTKQDCPTRLFPDRVARSIQSSSHSRFTEQIQTLRAHHLHHGKAF